ncbi:MAG: hypothetical protein C0624_07165 [Desulfuromonas sp.]|nr:MAG: hypothetical protein C0624_07165 [Desulfuromonas sp.]
MDSQRISKETCNVLFSLSDGREVWGEVFLDLYGALHSGPQRVGELLNSDEPFIPIKTDEGMMLIHLQQLVSAQVAADIELDELMTLGEHYRVTVQTVLGKSIDAEVYVNLPEGGRRVKDFMNRSQGFLRFIVGDQVLYLNRCFVVCVLD